MIRSLTIVLVVSAASLFGDSHAVKAQDSATEDAMQAKWIEFMTPGKAHQALEYKVGKWDLTVKMWPTPNSCAIGKRGDI